MPHKEACMPSPNAAPRSSAASWRGRLAPWALPLAIVLAWQLASSLGWLSVRVLPEPWSVLVAFWQLLRSGEMAHHVLVSSGRALSGFAIGGSLALTLGLLTGSFKR